MSAPSSSEGGWSTRLEPLRPVENVFLRPDDPRLGDRIIAWRGDESLLTPARPVLVGFPVDEGVKRNGGRAGASHAPAEIRRWLSGLTPWDGVSGVDLAQVPPLDAGNVRPAGNLESSQQALGEVVAGLLQREAIPVILGGGHETAYGHFLGHVLAGLKVGIINLDAHLDVRPSPEGRGNSGTSFRQAMEHPEHPLAGEHYVCLGVQPHATARAHWEYVRERGSIIRWAEECRGELKRLFAAELARLEKEGCQVMVTLDADVIEWGTVPGVSAPNGLGLEGREVLECLRLAGESSAVRSMDLVEINPAHDIDGHSTRWAALAVWYFLVGLGKRSRPGR